MAGDKRSWRKLFMLRDVLFLLALVLNNEWIMFIAMVGCVFTVAVQLRNDWKTNRKFDIITIIYVCVALALIVMLTNAIFVSLK